MHYGLPASSLSLFHISCKSADSVFRCCQVPTTLLACIYKLEATWMLPLKPQVVSINATSKATGCEHGCYLKSHRLSTWMLPQTPQVVNMDANLNAAGCEHAWPGAVTHVPISCWPCPIDLLSSSFKSPLCPSPPTPYLSNVL